MIYILQCNISTLNSISDSSLRCLRIKMNQNSCNDLGGIKPSLSTAYIKSHDIGRHGSKWMAPGLMATSIDLPVLFVLTLGSRQVSNDYIIATKSPRLHRF